MVFNFLQSYAKINIGLKITGQRPDGYHTLQTIFQEISLYDTIALEPTDQNWQITCANNTVPINETNLCIKAYLELKSHFPSLGGIKIHIKKGIPAGAGLGGGSSNAAALLKGINKLYDLGLTDGELEGIGLSLGADVPFFIRGGTQFAKGIGEVLFPATLPEMNAILLVVPDIHISTKWAYGLAKNHLPKNLKGGNFAPIPGVDESGISFASWENARELFENDFEPLIFQTYPEIGKIKEKLLEYGAQYTSLSGSGSTVFGIFKEEAQAHKVRTRFSSSLQTYLTHPI